MNKKKFLYVVLCTLFCILFLGAYSCCYADSTRTWTIEDLKNVVYNLAITKNSNETQVYNNIENNTANFTTMLNKINSSNQVTIALENSSGGTVYIFCNNQSNMAKPYFYSNRMTRYGTSGQTTRYQFICGNGSFSTETGAYAIETRYDLVQDKYYTSTPIYTSSGATTKKWDVGYSPSTLFEGRWVNTTWEFNYPSNSFFYTINGDSAQFNNSYCGITQGYQIELGTIVDSFYVEKIEYCFATWNGSVYNTTNWVTMYDKSRNGDILNYFPGTTTVQNNLYYTKLTLDTYNQGNNVLIVKVTPEDSELNTLWNYYYVVNNNTSIKNGVIYTGNTFSGDYNNQYQNQQNTNNIIDNQNQNDDYWKEQFDNLWVIDSGDVNELIGQVQNQLNMPSGEIADMQMILDMLQQNPGDFVISWGNYDPNITIKGEQIPRTNGQLFDRDGHFIKSGQINFSEIERNNATLQQVMSYVRIILTISICGILLRQYYLVILAILGVNIAIYGEETENKKTLQRTAEKEKQKTRSQIFNANQERLKEYNKMAKAKGWKK